MVGGSKSGGVENRPNGIIENNRIIVLFSSINIRNNINIDIRII